MMSVELLLEGVATTAGEGPHWDDKTQSLLFVDLRAATVYRWDSISGKLESRKLDGHCSSIIIPREAGGYIVSNNNKLLHLDWASGRTNELAVFDQETTHVLNDGKCDAKGRLWIGTMGNKPIKTAEDVVIGIGNLYLVDNNRQVILQKDKLSLTNGLAWTKDNKTMFHIDTFVNRVLAYDFDVEAGTISNERTVIDFNSPEHVGKLCHPDGMTIDEDDKLWVAIIANGKIARIDPLTGEVLRTVSFPCKGITSCCFGGRNMDELYVTSNPMHSHRNDTKQGSIFRVTGLGVKGLPANIFKG